MVWHAQAEAQQADDGADQLLDLSVGKAEHGAQRECGQDSDQRLPGLSAARCVRFDRQGRGSLVGEPDRQAATLAHTGVVGWSVGHPAPRPWDVTAAVLVQF